MLNSTLESSAEYIQKCEARISDLENSIYAQPTDVREEISKNLASTAVKNLGDIAYQRKFELEYREKIEALTKQLTLAEAKNRVSLFRILYTIIMQLVKVMSLSKLGIE